MALALTVGGGILPMLEIGVLAGTVLVLGVTVSVLRIGARRGEPPPGNSQRH